MRIFVFEYITGGGMLDSDLPSSLAVEGDMMLKALLSDLLEIDGVEIITTRDARLETPDLPVKFQLLHCVEDFRKVWLNCFAFADAVWPIAPEYGDILKHISEQVINAGKLLLNSPPQAVQIASSKMETAIRLSESGVSVVPTYRFEDSIPDRSGSWVLKPDDGVGCQGIKVCRDRDDLCAQIASLPTDREYVIQPFIYGTPISINLLTYNGKTFMLSINQQRIVRTDSGFLLLGCVVNGYSEHRARFHKIGRDLVNAMPDLWGIVGVDMIDTEHGLQVLEVNPRITTSYVGLKESTGVNPAALVLDLLDGRLPLSNQIFKALVVDVDLGCVGAA
jgi:predicted ATP-grasp superfamily ATP-dependent carboligase